MDSIGGLDFLFPNDFQLFLAKQILRLIDWIRKTTFLPMWNYFDNIIVHFNQLPHLCFDINNYIITFLSATNYYRDKKKNCNNVFF